jgi:hypothetical protein
VSAGTDSTRNPRYLAKYILQDRLPEWRVGHHSPQSYLMPRGKPRVRKSYGLK